MYHYLFAISFAIAVASFWLHAYLKREEEENALYNRIKSKRDVRYSDDIIFEKKQEHKNKTERQYENMLRDLKYRMTFKSLMAASLVCAVLGFFVGWLIFSMYSFGLFFGIGFYLIPMCYIRSQYEKRELLLEHQIDLMLNQMISVFRSNGTLLQALQGTVSLPEPLGIEMRRLNRDLNAGESMDKTLNRFAKRMRHADIDLLIKGLLISERRSTKIAQDVLESCRQTIMDNQRSRQELGALLTVGRLTAHIFGLAPIVMFLLLRTISPDMIEPLYKLQGGEYITFAMLTLNVIGYRSALQVASIKRLAKRGA